MSRFTIYQINYYDPQILGRRKRRLLYIYTGIVLAFTLVIQLLTAVFHTEVLLFISVSMPLIFILFLYLRSKAKPDLNQIKTIGDIEFTQSGIKKRIGDSLTEYEFREIEKIELQKHIPDLSPIIRVSGGYFSYILKIVFRNSVTESLVISGKNSDHFKNLTIVDTMRTLKKIIKTEILIE
jgi:hypothetical protein